MYEALLGALEASPLGEAARHSAWLYPAANLVHVLAAALVFGAIAVLDLRLILGRPKPLDAPALARLAATVAAVGVLTAVPSGLVLLAAEAGALGVNPAFGLKMAALAIALANVAVVHRRYRPGLTRYGSDGAARLHGALSLVSWAVVLLAGRGMAYL